MGDSEKTSSAKEIARDTPRVPKRPRWRFVLAAMFLSATLAVILVETFFRLFVSVTDVPFQFWDPVVGPRRSPHQKGMSLSGQSVRARYNFNAQGWNYPTDFSFPRPDSTRRICMVGDSYVEALQVDCDKQMAVLLEKDLSRPDRPVQCYPFGVSGFGTAQEYQIIHHYVLDYRPDVVILFFTANDVYDCSPYLNPIAPSYARYSLGEENELERMDMLPWEPSSLRRLASKFAVARYVIVQKRLLNPRGAAGPAGITLREASPEMSTEEFPGAKLTQDERGKKSWELIERLLAATNADCQSREATLVIVYRGNLAEIEAAERNEPFSRIPKEKDPYCINERVLDMGRDHLEPIAARLHIPFLDLTEPLIAHFRSTNQAHNFSDDDHFNEIGHAVSAERMAALVQPILDRSKPGGRSSH